MHLSKTQLMPLHKAGAFPLNNSSAPTTATATATATFATRPDSLWLERTALLNARVDWHMPPHSDCDCDSWLLAVGCRLLPILGHATFVYFGNVYKKPMRATCNRILPCLQTHDMTATLKAHVAMRPLVVCPACTFSFSWADDTALVKRCVGLFMPCT